MWLIPSSIRVPVTVTARRRDLGTGKDQNLSAGVEAETLVQGWWDGQVGPEFLQGRGLVLRLPVGAGGQVSG